MPPVPPFRLVGGARREAPVCVLLAAIVIAFASVNLEHYPVITGWDEGMYLETAANVVRTGDYGTRNGAVIDRLQPPGGSGATLILPIAAVFGVTGIDLLAARMVIALTLVLAAAGVYALLRRLQGPLAAAIGVAFFLAAGYPQFDSVLIGRQVLAEAPGMALLIWGLYFWVDSWRGRPWALVVASVLFGLAVITKNQWILVVGGGVALTTLAGRVTHGMPWRLGVYPLAGAVGGYLAWTAATYWIAGDQWHRYREALNALTSATFYHLSVERSLQNLRLFYQGGQWFWVPLSLAPLVVSLMRTSEPAERRQALLLPAFMAASLAAAVVLTPGWPRYLYPTLVLAGLGSAVAIAQLCMARGVTARGAMAAVAVTALLTGPRLAGHVAGMTLPPDRSAEHFARMVDAEVPASAVVMNWEWEIDFLANRPFVHPPAVLFAAMVDDIYNRRRRRPAVLDAPRLTNDVDYVVVGPFASGTRVFDAELEQRRATLVTRSGAYRLYALAPPDDVSAATQ